MQVDCSAVAEAEHLHLDVARFGDAAFKVHGAVAEGARPHGLRRLHRLLKVFHAIDVFYTRLLEWSMSHRAIVAGVSVLVLLSSVPLFMMANKNFMPQDDQSEFEVNLRADEGTSLESTEVLTNRIANAIRQRIPEVDYTLVTIAGDPAKTRNLGTI